MFDDVQIKLSETLANIENRTDEELNSVLEDTLMRVGTGYPIDAANDRYKLIYRESDRRYSQQGIPNPNPFNNLWDFRLFWKDNELTTYDSRRAYVGRIYNQGSAPNSTWQSINQTIAAVARSRYESGHYADSVEASFKEINSRIKEEVRQRTGGTFDGADLMNQAFSPNKPVVVLDDLETENGVNIQKGYMLMLAGAMTALRNPPSHANLDIEPDSAMQQIQFASMLYSKYESAINRDRSQLLNAPVDTDVEKVYAHVKNPDDSDTLLKMKAILNQHEGELPIILVLGIDKKSAIRLPMKVDGSDQLLAKLVKLLGEDAVVAK
jgi:uncharacterized protein (TIGR02391 family)